MYILSDSVESRTTEIKTFNEENMTHPAHTKKTTKSIITQATHLDGTAGELEAVHGPESGVRRPVVDVLDETEALVPPR